MPDFTNIGRKDFAGRAAARMAAWLGDATIMAPVLLHVPATSASKCLLQVGVGGFSSPHQDGTTTA